MDASRPGSLAIRLPSGRGGIDDGVVRVDDRAAAGCERRLLPFEDRPEPVPRLQR